MVHTTQDLDRFKPLNSVIPYILFVFSGLYWVRLMLCQSRLEVFLPIHVPLPLGLLVSYKVEVLVGLQDMSSSRITEESQQESVFFLPLGTEGSIPDKRDLINSMIQLLTGQCMNRNEVKDDVKVRSNNNDHSSVCGGCTERLTGSAWKNPWDKICSRQDSTA